MKPGVSPPTLVDGGVEAQARQAFENLKAVLAQSGSSLKNVLKVTAILDTIKDYAAFNKICQCSGIPARARNSESN